mgnify:CR=1 FL=1
MLTQNQYDAIRTWVDNGHALAPEDAKALLETFEATYAAADHMIEHGDDSFLLDLMFDPEGEPVLAVRAQPGELVAASTEALEEAAAERHTELEDS